jgi:hypothetical protein
MVVEPAVAKAVPVVGLPLVTQPEKACRSPVDHAEVVQLNVKFAAATSPAVARFHSMAISTGEPPAIPWPYCSSVNPLADTVSAELNSTCNTARSMSSTANPAGFAMVILEDVPPP